LIVIYNHRYDKNIDIIEKIYENRFTNIFHLMPFYDGNKQNVIPIYENSYYFQGYIAQGLKSYFNEKYEHYFFVADDMILNPIINEENYMKIFKLDLETDFISELFYPKNSYWTHTRHSIEYKMKLAGLEIANLLPSYDVALEKIEHFGIKQEYISAKYAYGENAYIDGNYKPSYPMAGSYSDIAVVSKYSIKKFCYYCGIFAASHLFVEWALPTSLVLACKKIISEKDLTLQGRALWTEQDYGILEKYEQNLKQLLDEFLLAKFGKTLYEIYFKPYNEKIWNCNLSEISLDWLADKLPNPSIWEIIYNNFVKVNETSMVHSVFYYPKEISALKGKLQKENFLLLGRFAEWEYYNMDTAIEAAKKIIPDILEDT